MRELLPLHAQLARHLAEFARPMPIGKILDMEIFGAQAHHQVYYLLKKGREENLLISEGSYRHTTWQASPDLRLQVLREQLQQPLEKRPRVGYDQTFLEEYEPNKTHYLSDPQRKRLRERCPPGSAQFSSLNAHDQSLFMCGLSYASSAMEGNNYDMAATVNLLMDGVKKEGADPRETTMVLNHHEAVRYLVDNIHHPTRHGDVDVSAMAIKSIHGLLSSFLLKDDLDCGRIRSTPVLIQQSSYIPLSLGTTIEYCFNLMLRKTNEIECPYEKAMFLLTHLPYLQPFVDCNKRTARVSCNIPLLRAGVVPMSWLDVSHPHFTEGMIGVYERCNPSLLAEIFTEGYVHSTERFDVMRRTATPDLTRVKYRTEIKQAVRAAVLDNEDALPAGVDPKDQAAFSAFVQSDLQKLRDRHQSMMVLYRLSDGEIADWENRASRQRERMR